MAKRLPDRELIRSLVEAMDDEWFQAWKQEIDRRSERGDLA